MVRPNVLSCLGECASFPGARVELSHENVWLLTVKALSLVQHPTLDLADTYTHDELARGKTTEAILYPFGHARSDGRNVACWSVTDYRVKTGRQFSHFRS
jgi:hypothetical protein